MRAHGFASSVGRVAGGPIDSEHPRRQSDRGFRPGPTPPSFGGRLSTSSTRQSLFSKNGREIARRVPKSRRCRATRTDTRGVVDFATGCAGNARAISSALHKWPERRLGTRHPNRPGDSPLIRAASRSPRESCGTRGGRAPDGNRGAHPVDADLPEFCTSPVVPRIVRVPARRLGVAGRRFERRIGGRRKPRPRPRVSGTRRA